MECRIPDAEIIHKNGKDILVLSIKEFPIKPVSYRGKYFKRHKNANQLLNVTEVVDMHLRSFNTSWDYHIDSIHTLDQISMDKVQALIDRMNDPEVRFKGEPMSLLRKLELVRGNQPSNASFLLFMEDESVMTTIELGRFQTETIIKDSQRTKSDVLTEVNVVMDFNC